MAGVMYSVEQIIHKFLDNFLRALHSEASMCS